MAMNEEAAKSFRQEIDPWGIPKLKACSEDREHFTPEKILIMTTRIHHLEHSQFVNLQLNESRRSLLRLLIFGNAGGAIATLSFIGTIVGKSPDNTFDRAMFIVLVFFTLGLAGGWLARTSEMAIFGYDREKSRTDDINEIERLKAKKSEWASTFSVSIVFCFAMVVIGFCMGFYRLWQMTT